MKQLYPLLNTFFNLKTPWSRAALLVLTLLCALAAPQRSYAQCGIDISIANDNSGSVDATEDKQARTFIKNLGASLTLGTANTESRIAISSWASTNTWVEYTFPSAGANYTTVQSDLVAYANAPRVLNGGTDPYQALQKTYNVVNQTPVGGRTVPKVIILMTDASPGQVQPAIKTLAAQIKAAGIYIMVLAVNPASTITDLQGTNVASPGMYFSAASYAALATGAQALINNMVTSLCTTTVTNWDLTVALTAMNCVTGQATYTVSNVGNAAFTNQTISVSFYDGDPTLPTTKLLSSTTHANQTIAAGGTGSLTFTDPAMAGKAKVYAVVNISTTGSNATPPLPYNLTGRLAITTEGGATNNRSGAFSATGCTAGPVLEVTKTAGGISCDKKVTYNVQVCNTGTVDAANVGITDYPPTGFVLESSTGTLPGSGGGSISTSTLPYIGRKIWGTYAGNTNTHDLGSVVTDATGAIYVSGSCEAADPVGAGGHQPGYGGALDGVLYKFAADGKTLIWATHYGGTDEDEIYDVHVDVFGNVYISGRTQSTTGIATAGAHKTVLEGGEDAFIAKFNSAGVRQWGTYYGGEDLDEHIYTITSDASGNIYIGGSTSSSTGIATAGTFRATTPGLGEVPFTAKLNASGVRQWGTYNCTSEGDGPVFDIQVSGNNVYVCGRWNSDTNGGIPSAGAFKTTQTSGEVDNGFIMNLNATNGTRTSATLFGGTGSERFYSIEIDGSGDVIVGGYATSTGLGTAGTFQQNLSTGLDGILVKFNGALTSRTWATYYGGSGTDWVSEIVLSGSKIFVAGTTASAGMASAGTYQPAQGGAIDNFVAVMNNSNGTRDNATYIGGAQNDGSNQPSIPSVTLNAAGEVLVAGITRSTAAIATTGAFDVTHPDGTTDILYVMKLGDNVTETITTLKAGECATLSYVFDASNATIGAKDNSVGVTTTTASTTYLPNTNFTANSVSGLNGYNGAVNAGENVTIPASTGCSQTPQAITTAVSITPSSSCGGAGNYVTATVTITNPNTQSSGGGTGITIFNANEQLNLTGTGAKFAGEPYSITNGLSLAQANTLDPAYPAVANALYGTTGTQNLQIYQIPPGTSTFMIDIDAGTATLNLASTVTNIPTTYNATGSSNTATDATGVTINAAPTATITTAACGGSVTTAAATIALSGTTTGATSRTWVSNTNSSIANTGTVAAPTATYTINDQDRANGYVDFTLTALSAAGCDATATCRVTITGATYDYGDLPTTYDLSQSASPTAAAAYAPGTTLRMGSTGLDAEATAQPSSTASSDDANGTDDEDGIATFNSITTGQTTYSVNVTVTNTTGSTANFCGWIDWNGNGRFEPAEGVCTTVATGTTNGTATLNWTGINSGSGAPLGILGYARFRITTGALTVFDYIGSTSNGEVEDYQILNAPLPLTLLSFDATKSDPDALLTWTTATEQNTAYFSIEHSYTGRDFTSIGKQSAAGDSKELRKYGFVHATAGTGTHYYRLKMVDKDNSFTYSPIRVVSFDNNGKVLLYPNPTSEQVTVTGIEAGMEINISSVEGQSLIRQSAKSETEPLDTRSLSSGMYLLQVRKEGRLITTLKLVKK